MSAPPASGKKIRCPECAEIFSPSEAGAPPRSRASADPTDKPPSRIRGDDRITSPRGKQNTRPVVPPAEPADSHRSSKRRTKLKKDGLHPAVFWGAVGGGALVMLLAGIGLAYALRDRKAPDTSIAAAGPISGGTGNTTPNPTSPTQPPTATTNPSGFSPIKPASPGGETDPPSKPATPATPVSTPVTVQPPAEPVLAPYKPSRLLTGLGTGYLAPDLQGPDLAGKAFKLSDYRGKVVLIDFWANWCGFCVKMYPYERELSQRLAKKPFALLGVNCDQQIQIPRGVLGKEKIAMRCWFDGPRGPLSDSCGISGFPSFLLIDHKGVIRLFHSGFIQNTKALDTQIDTLIAEAEADAKTVPVTTTPVSTTIPPNPKAPKPPVVGFVVGNLAPDIEGLDLDGKVFMLEEYRGQVVVLDFWGNWCGFCHKMYPYERELTRRMKGQPFALLGVNTDRTRGVAKTVLDKEEISMRCWFDVGKPICLQYGIAGFPTLYVIDHKGILRHKHVGAMEEKQTKELDKFLDKLVAEARAEQKK